MDAFKYYLSLSVSERRASRTKEGRRKFWMAGVDSDAIWEGGWGRPNRPDSPTSFHFPTDESLRSANLREMARRHVPYQRVHGRPLGSRITISTDSKEFGLVLDEIDSWLDMPVEAYTHRRFGCNPADRNKRSDWGSAAFRELSGDTSPYDWSMFTLNDTPAQVAFGRDIVRLLPEHDRFLVDVPDGQEVYVRFWEVRPYGDGESDEVGTETATRFCKMYDIFLTNGVYDEGTLECVREEVENQVVGEFASYAAAVLENQQDVERFCQQFYGCSAEVRLMQMMDEEFFWGDDEAYRPEMELNDPEGGRTSAETRTCDEGLAAAYAVWLHRQWQAHVAGEVALPAFDQPGLSL